MSDGLASSKLSDGLESSKLSDGLESSKLSDGLESSKLSDGLESSKLSDGLNSFKFSPEELQLRADAGRNLIPRASLERPSDKLVIGTHWEWTKAHHLLWKSIFQKQKEWNGGHDVEVEWRVYTLKAKQITWTPVGENITYILPITEVGAEVVFKTATGQIIPALDWPERWYELKQKHGIGSTKAEISFLMLTVSASKDILSKAK